MKYLIVSDIHGCLPRLEQVLDFFEKEGYEMLLVAGDINNYGPRNGVPEGLDAKGVTERLNAMADRIVAVRGNCDAEVDQMILKFPMMSDSAIVVADGIRLFMTHGHNIRPENRPELGMDVFISGHTHLWELRRDRDVLVLNTGSITFPKEGRPATFATLDEDAHIRVRTLDGKVLADAAL